MEKKILKEVLGALLGEESLSEVRAYGNGHINDTFLVRSKGKQGQEKKQILQKINTAIFQKPEELMENVVQVTAYLEKKIQGRRRRSRKGDTAFSDVFQWKTVLCGSDWRLVAFQHPGGTYHML